MAMARATTLQSVTSASGLSDDVFGVALERIIEPAVRRFAPDFILLSLGFDAFWEDPLANLRLSIAGAYTPLVRSAR